MTRKTPPSFSISEQDKNVEQFFNDEALKYMDHYDTDDHDPFAYKARRNIVQSFISPRAEGRALDVGCGPGVMAPFFLKNDMTFDGVDVAPSVIEEGKALYAEEENVTFSVGRVEHLEYPDNHFDAVTAMGVLEYLDDDALAINEMVRTLKVGGTLVVTVPNRIAPYRILHKAIHPGLMNMCINGLKMLLRRPPSPSIYHREYTQQHIKKQFKECGIDFQQVGYYGYNILPYPLDKMFEVANGQIASKLLSLDQTPLRWLGTGMVVAGTKK